MALDDEKSARQAQEVDPDDQQFVKITAAMRKHIFGQGAQALLQGMAQADDVGRVMGEMVFSLLREVVMQAQQSGQEMSYDVLVGVATEMIDDMTELAQANGIKIQQKDREFALMYAQQLYVENHQPSDEERAAAKQDLASMKEGGEVDQAVSYVQQRGMENGADPFGVNEMGAERPQMMGGGREQQQPQE